MPLIILAAAALLSVSGRTALATSSSVLSVFAAEDAACSGRATRSFVLPTGADFRSAVPVRGVSQVLAEGAAGSATAGAMSMWCASSGLAVRWCPEGTAPETESGASCGSRKGFYTVVAEGLASISCAHGLGFDTGSTDVVSMLRQHAEGREGFNLRLIGAEGAEIPHLPVCSGAEGVRQISGWVDMSFGAVDQEDSRRLSEDTTTTLAPSEHQTFGTILLIITMALFCMLICVLCIIDRLCYSRMESASLVPEPS
mmetsp:Transcript_74742/g.167634  ORF Transcript_74742/g.167634 Transcript_74742/m.167634 type:complete len:256 (-) Transcript_74742:126-893(-)